MGVIRGGDDDAIDTGICQHQIEICINACAWPISGNKLGLTGGNRTDRSTPGMGNQRRMEGGAGKTIAEQTDLQ